MAGSLKEMTKCVYFKHQECYRTQEQKLKPNKLSNLSCNF